MANWRENKAVGVAAAVLFILAMIFTVRGIIGARPAQPKLTGAGEKVIPPAEEMLRINKGGK
jgi:hypothetical protein